MSLIGTRIKEKGRDGALYDVAGAAGGSYVCVPVNFGPSEVLTVSDLVQRFNVTDAQPAPHPATSDPIIETYDDSRGWLNLAEMHRRTDVGRRPASLPVAEDTFSVVSSDGRDSTAARRLAVAALAGPDAAKVRNGDTALVPLHPAVWTEVRKLIAQETGA